MATAGSTIASLIETSKELESMAAAIQGDHELLVNDQDIDELAVRYQEWLARSLAVLPAEFEQRFRDEYQGGFFSSKIKDFLLNPGAKNVLWSEEAEIELIPYWQHPFESAFKAPLMNQRQILAEARFQLEGPGEMSQDLDVLERLCRRFDSYLAPLADRGRGREPFVVEDEYDVQIALHAILNAYFDDVRPEDPTPQRAGGSSRVDFLLKSERIVVETKMTRSGLGARQIGEELIIDIERYKAHPECGALVALVYDPDRLISNRRALETDLSRTHDGLVVRVFIVQ